MTSSTFTVKMNKLRALINEQDKAHQYDEAQKNRRLIESKIAEKIISEPMLISNSVNKVSESFIELLQANTLLIENDTTLHSLLMETIKGLYHEDAFGRLISTEKDSTEKDNIDFVINLLKNSKDLPILIHLHALLGQHLVRPLLNHPDVSTDKVLPESDTLASTAARLVAKTPHLREELRKKFYLYKTNDRGRFEAKKGAGATTEIGILQENSSHVGEYHPSHVRAADRFLPDMEHPYYKNYIQNSSLPFVAGPSGHAGILFRTATMVAHLSASEMKEYTLAVLAMIVGGGMHSTNEIMIMFERLGFEYSKGDYQLIIDLIDEKTVSMNQLNFFAEEQKTKIEEELLMSYNEIRELEEFPVEQKRKMEYLISNRPSALQDAKQHVECVPTRWGLLRG